MNHLRFIFKSLLVLLISQNVYSFNKLKTYEPRTFEISGGATYFATTSNFNNVGTNVNLLGSNKYALLDSFLEARYVFKELWSVKGQAFITNAESKNTDFTRTNSTLNMLSLSADWMVYRGFMDVIPELSVLYSLDPIADNQDSVMTNEGTTEITGMIKAQNNYSWFSYYGGIGYKFRSERSGVMPWYLGGGLQWKYSFLGLELGGFQTIVDDGANGTEESARNALMQKVNAGSYRFYTVNPSHIEARVNLDIGFSRGFVLKTFLANSISGQMYSSGMTAGVAVTLLFDTFSNNPHKTYEPIKETPVRQQEDDYEIQTQDGVDQKLFQKEPEPEPVRVQEPPKKQFNKVPSNDELQDQLDQAEMSIKLKSKKRKKKR